jgi:addiction module HigA family antidote
MAKTIPLPTPGEILNLEFLEPMGITPYRLAQAIHVPQTRIGAIINDGRAITADTALRLARFFGTSAELWLNLQAQYDADVAKEAISKELETITPFAMSA